MAKAIYYPKANRTAQWYGTGKFEGSPITPNCFVWHTTETGGWPGYGSGASMPHLTYHPGLRQWRQHCRLDRSARALRNLAGGVETNTANVIQVEIIAYSDENLAASRGHTGVSKLSDANLRDLGEFARFMFDEWGLKLEIDSGWVRSNYRNPTRMSFTRWRAFLGHTGHNRVPENTHWDPGALKIDKVIEYAKGTTEEDDMPTAEEIAEAVWGRVNPTVNLQYGTLMRYAGRTAPSKISGKETTPTTKQQYAQLEATNAHTVAREVLAEVVALRALVATMIERDPSNTLTAAEAKMIVENAIRDNVVKVQVSIEGAEDGEPGDG